MPLSRDELADSRNRVYRMLKLTVKNFELIEENSIELFGKKKGMAVRLAIRECLDDFIYKPELADQPDPRILIRNASISDLQRSGFYGAQLDLKETQVIEANRNLRKGLLRIERGDRSPWRFLKSPFKSWIDRINNFLGSLSSGTGFGEALQELKDCLRDEMPDDE